VDLDILRTPISSYANSGRVGCGTRLTPPTDCGDRTASRNQPGSG
jgi:hypothetical protein